MTSDKAENIHSLWSLYVGEFHNYDHPLIKSDLINFFNEYEKKLPEGNKQLRQKDYVGNYNLYQSNYDLHLENNEVLKKLFNFIANSILTTCKIANKKIIEKLNNKDQKFKVNIDESWFIKYKDKGLVYPHIHDGCSWCCVYYVNIGKDAKKMNGSTFFLRPYAGTSKIDFGGKYLANDTRIFNAEEGKLLVWPNFLIHGSHPYEGKEKRIIISANTTVDLLEDA